jgi:antitoxin component of MazEF toxin-antitoxin module
MCIRVEKRPGGLAVAVSDALAVQAGLLDCRPADLEMVDGWLIVNPGGPARLAELLVGVTPENLHSEWAAGPPDGAELL